MPQYQSLDRRERGKLRLDEASSATEVRLYVDGDFLSIRSAVALA
jgi:hypothetical protein